MPWEEMVPPMQHLMRMEVIVALGTPLPGVWEFMMAQPNLLLVMGQWLVPQTQPNIALLRWWQSAHELAR